MSFNIVLGSSRMQLILTASSDEGIEIQDLRMRKSVNYELHNVNIPIQYEESQQPINELFDSRSIYHRGLNIYPTRLRITNYKNNNLTINYKKGAMFQKA